MSKPMMSHEHTFVICAYGESLFLEECIKSLINQELKTNIMIYTSTPNSLITELGQQYEIPVHTKEGGSIGKDWNNALSFVTTKYATIAHQDDVYLTEYTKDVLAQFEKKPDALIAYTNYSEWKDGTVIPKNTNLKIKDMMLKTMSLSKKSKLLRNRVMSLGNPICCPAVTYNMEQLKDFKFDEEMKVSLDWLAWYEIGKHKGEFLFINKALMWHRIHDESETTNSISDNTRTKEDIYMFNKFWPKPVANAIMKFYAKSQDTNQ